MLSYKAPAKVNLYLQIVGLDRKGYHILDSLVVFTQIHDFLTFRPAADLSLTTDGPFSKDLCPPADNLVIKAAQKLAERFSISQGASIHLTKNLPVAAGIGGGSSDTAATLLALNQLWGIHAKVKDLMSLGLELGADVPMCLEGKPTFVGNIGEVLFPVSPFPSSEFALLLVNPKVPVSTSQVFQRWRQHHGDYFFKPVGFCLTGDFGLTIEDLLSGLSRCRNELFDAACFFAPVLKEVISLIDKTRGCRMARMSGSGGTCFGIFDVLEEAESAADHLKALHPAWWIQATGVAP